MREGINTLLPVATVGGDFVGARLLTKRGVAGGLAGASMFVDMMTQALTQLLFTVAGLGLLFWLSGDGPIVRTVAGGLAVAAPAIGAFYLIQRRAGHRLIQGIVDRFASGREWQALGAVDVLFDNLRRLYAAPLRILSGIGVHLVGWLIGTIEVYVCLRFMGYPVSFAEAVVIESLAQAVRGAAFAVPGALGAQEGGLIALCALFGIPAEAALALSLVKRLADLLIGVPGLWLWHTQEGRYPPRGGRGGRRRAGWPGETTATSGRRRERPGEARPVLQLCRAARHEGPQRGRPGAGVQEVRLMRRCLIALALVAGAPSRPSAATTRRSPLSTGSTPASTPP